LNRTVQDVAAAYLDDVWMVKPSQNRDFSQATLGVAGALFVGRNVTMKTA
jgi:hypothetical protein